MNTKYEGLRINILQTTQSKKAFTLVELIIVITILAILATIAFISFKNYAGNARDGNKLTTLSNIEKGLNLYQLKTGTYPIPDTPYGSGNYSGALLSQVGYIGSEVIQAINMNKIPKDPTVDHTYTYGLSNNKKYYQVGTALETLQTSFINQTYANNYTSKVVGNYKGLYKFGTGGVNYIMNLPSLLFTESGEQDFGNNTNNPKFVIHNGGNLVKPYHENNNESIDTTLLKLTGTGVSLTGAVIPATFEDWNTQSGTLKDSLGYSEDTIGHKIYGDYYNSDNKNLHVSPPAPIVYESCNFEGNTVEHATSVTAYETASVTFGNTCTSEQRSCDNGILSGSFTHASCNVDGATGIFTLSQTSVTAGTSVTISNTCSTAPTSYTSSNTSVASISGTTITAISAGTTTIAPVGGACGDNSGKTLTVTVPTCTSFTYSTWGACQSNSTQTRTILTQSPNLCTGGSPVLQQSCTYVPTCTSFSYSAWGSCQSNSKQIRTIATRNPNGCTGGTPATLEQNCTYIPPTYYQGSCTANGQIIYTNNVGVEIGRVNNAGTTTSGNPGTLVASGHIVVCTGSKLGHVLKSVNEGASTVGISSASYGNYYQWGNNWGGPAGTTTSTTRPTCTVNSTMNHTSFVTGNADWCSTQTDNLWGSTTGTNIGMKGPCPTGYHVPSQLEWQAVITAWGGTNILNALKLPLAGQRDRSAGASMNYLGRGGYYWSSSSYGANGYKLYVQSGGAHISSDNRAHGASVRCFKN